MSAALSDVVIIGAGPAGIGAALALGKSATVLEALPEAAGLSRTIVRGGVTFDLGGHSFHTPHPEIRALVFDALEMEEQTRDAWVWAEGDWVRYPFQKYFADLSCPEQRAACAAGLAANAPWQDAQNFDEHISRRFGAGIAEHFMRPYNRKVWGQNLARMEADWTAERVAAPAGTAESFDAAGGKRKPLQSGTKIAYPARGGFGEIFAALARQLHDLRLRQTVTAIDPAKNSLSTAGGQTHRWQKLVSTLPLPRLLTLLPDVPAALLHAAAALEALPVNLVMITFDGKISTSRQRVYNAGAMPGHKIVFNNTSSQSLRAAARHGIQVEISGDATDIAALTQAVVAGLRRMGLVEDPGRITGTSVIQLDHGYPVPTHQRPAIVAAIKSWLRERNIFTAGRFGEWAYVNADESLHRGLTLGRELAAA